MDGKDQILMDNNGNTNQNDLSKSIVNNKYNTSSNDERKTSIWSILILMCLLAIVGGLTYFFIFELNAKALTLNGITKMTNQLKTIYEPLNVDYSIDTDKFSLNNKLTFAVNGSNLGDVKSIINESEINTSIMYDRKNKKMFTDIDSKIDNVKIDVDGYIENKNAYLLLHEIYDKYIKFEDIKVDIFKSSLKKEDLQHIYAIAIDSVKNNLDDMLFTRQISFDDGPIATTELNLDRFQLTKIINNVKKDVLNDSKVNDILSIYYDKDKINELKNTEIKDEKIEIENLYVKVVQSILKDDLRSVEFTIKQHDEKYTITAVRKNNVIDITAYEGDSIDYAITINFNDKNFDLEYKYVYEKDEKEEDDDEQKENTIKTIFTLQGRSDSDYYTYILNYPGETAEEKIELTYKVKFNVGNTLAFDMSLGIKIGEYDVIIKSEGNIGPLTNDINVDASNYTEIEEVNTEELYKKLQEKFAPLIEKYSKEIENQIS